jgi:hypothetical protein
MENNETGAGYNTLPLQLDQHSVSYLKEICRWARFLSIMGFVVVGLMLLFGLFLGAFLNNYSSPLLTSLPMGTFSIAYAFIAVLYFFPVFYLYRFSSFLKNAILESNNEYLTRSIENLKLLFRFIGIFTVAIISLYLIAFVSAIVFDLFRSH